MKKLVYYLLLTILILPTIVFASSTYSESIDVANKYIYDFEDYSRYIKLTGDLPYGVNSSNKLIVLSDFKTGGFLNEKEYLTSAVKGTSWLAPGIGFWLVDRKILDVKFQSFPNPNMVSGVRVTEFVRHDTKVKGVGTKTNPWYFTDGYVVKVGSSDLSSGTATGGCEHVPEGGSCKFNLAYNTAMGVNINNCKKIVESKGSTLTLNGNELIISDVHGDISCFIDFGTNSKCIKVTFNNDDGSGGMTSPIYYKYGYGWFSDSLCLSKVSSVSRPTKTGHIFNGYKINSIVVIDATPKIAAGIKEDITSDSNTVEAKASWTKCTAGTYLNGNRCVDCTAGSYSSAGAGSCTPCPAGTYQPDAGKSSCNPCTAGSYSIAGLNRCIACTNGKTSNAKSGSCPKNCLNNANVSQWETAYWNTNNTVTNNCRIRSCNSGYRLSSNKCVRNTCSNWGDDIWITGPSERSCNNAVADWISDNYPHGEMYVDYNCGMSQANQYCTYNRGGGYWNAACKRCND